MLKLIGTCMVSNEADIIEAFVRHNLRFLDHLVLLDHASVDATPGILQALVEEGLPLLLLRDPDPAFHQGNRQTLMARKFLGELDADFSFALDADEFIVAESRPALDMELSKVRAGACGVLRMRNYLAGPPGARDEVNPALRLTWRPKVEARPPHKVIVARAFASDPNAQVSRGNHAVVTISDGKVQPFPHQLLLAASLAHFPIRSAEQVAKKALLGWLAHRLTKPERIHGASASAVPASHWRDLFQGISEGRVGVDEGLLNEARAIYAGGQRLDAGDEGAWVDDGIGAQYTLRHTPAVTPPALAALAAWADRLVTVANEKTAG